MTDAVQQPAKAASHADAHPRLYHYTGEHAFKSIVGNNTLWATYFEDLNDASEFKVLLTPLAEELGDRFILTVETFANRGEWQAETVRSKGGVRPAAAEIGKILMNNLYKGTFGAPFSESFYPCFVSSFCSHKPDGYTEDNGLLSQWRGYGGGQDGSYCLVFDTRRFEALMKEEQEAYQYFFMGLGVAHYFKDRKEMPPYFAELAERSKTVVEAILSGSDPALDVLFEPSLERLFGIGIRSVLGGIHNDSELLPRRMNIVVVERAVRQSEGRGRPAARLGVARHDIAMRDGERRMMRLDIHAVPEHVAAPVAKDSGSPSKLRSGFQLSSPGRSRFIQI